MGITVLTELHRATRTEPEVKIFDVVAARDHSARQDFSACVQNSFAIMIIAAGPRGPYAVLWLPALKKVTRKSSVRESVDVRISGVAGVELEVRAGTGRSAALRMQRSRGQDLVRYGHLACLRLPIDGKAL